MSRSVCVSRFSGVLSSVVSVLLLVPISSMVKAIACRIFEAVHDMCVEVSVCRSIVYAKVVGVSCSSLLHMLFFCKISWASCMLRTSVLIPFASAYLSRFCLLKGIRLLLAALMVMLLLLVLVLVGADLTFFPPDFAGMAWFLLVYGMDVRVFSE